MQKISYLKLQKGYRTALMDGMLVPNSAQHMATERLYHAVRGSRLHLCLEEYVFAVAIFALERDTQYVYSYAYQKEENWTTYTVNLTPDSYAAADYVFEEECYFRVCVRRADGADITAEDAACSAKIIEYYHEEPEYITPAYFQTEIDETVDSIRGKCSAQTLKLCMLTDSHVTVNGTWKDTANNMQKVSEQVGFDAVIHLGDMTDGMLSKELTGECVESMIEDMEQCGAPVFIVPGNHDSNYFYNEPNMFTMQEMQQLYRLPGETLDYYIDLPDYKVRMICISSFEHTAPVRYGYSDQQLQWLREVLSSAKDGTRFMILSHDAPLAKLDYWSFLIRNGEALLDILEEYNAKPEYQIIGFFYGHVHADAYFDECSFPVVAIGCNKTEYFLDKKPAGAVVAYRELGTVTQDLWDSVLIDFEKQIIHMIRFGAGENREFSYAKKPSIYKEVFRNERTLRKTQVWAHRGASGHAPENTMPAFELAYELGANGIELDVQLTKDGVPVVIHDETLNRVCGVNGQVKDYTLAELKTFSANLYYPAYGEEVRIPTLEEVYDFVKTTDMLVNVELKTNHIRYEGMEEKVLKLAEEKGISDRIIYSSFNHYSVKKVQELAPMAKIAFLYADGFMDMAEYADKYNVYALHPFVGQVRATNVVQECHDKGIRVHVWTVNEGIDIEEMKRTGVDAIITNFVERG